MAKELGFVHPDVMLKNMTARQYVEWRIYYGIEPFGVEYEDTQAAFTRHIIASAGGLTKKGTKKVPTIEELKLLTSTQAKRKQSIEEMKNILYALAGRLNG